MRIRPALPAVALIALALPLAACSGDDAGDASFCDQATEALSEVDATGALGDDAEGFADAVHEIRVSFEAADPAPEIADDWDALTQTFIDLDESLTGVDPTDEAAFTAALSEFDERAASTELSDASDRVSAYVTENCTL